MSSGRRRAAESRECDFSGYPDHELARIEDDPMVEVRREFKRLESFTFDAFRSEVLREVKQCFWVSLILQRMLLKLLWALPLIWVHDFVSVSWDLVRWFMRVVTKELSLLLCVTHRPQERRAVYRYGRSRRYQRRVLPRWLFLAASLSWTLFALLAPTSQ